MTPIDEWKRAAVQGLLADADRVLALAELDSVRENREIVEHAIANARKNYIDLMRRSRPLIMTDGEKTRFQNIMDRLKARLRLFGDAV